MRRTKSLSDLREGLGRISIHEQEQTEKSRSEGRYQLTTSVSGPIPKETRNSPHGKNVNAYKTERKAIVINNIMFKDGQTDRKGGEVDTEKASTLLKNLGFIPIENENLVKDDMCKKIEEAAKDTASNSKSDCFAFMLMSHGNEKSIITSDSQEISLEEISSPFAPPACNSLKDKPKLFFIQACRGNQEDRGQSTNGTVSSSTTSVPNAKDFLMHYATPPGFLAYRNQIDGTLFVQALAAAVNKNPEREIFHLLTEVNMDVSEKDINKCKQIPFIASTLTKQLYLHEKESYTNAIQPRSSDNKYDMEHEHRGIALIITNDTVKSKYDDKKKLGDLFKELGFTVDTESGIEFIKAGYEPKDSKSSDCFLCVLMREFSDDQHISDILNYFKKCKVGLLGKPKILIIVSCQTVNNLQPDTLSGRKLIPTMADVLVVTAHVPYPYEADLKNAEGESIFVKELDSALRSEDLKDCILLNLITRVFGKTTEKVKDMAHVPFFTSTLRRDLFLNRKEGSRIQTADHQDQEYINIHHDDQNCSITDLTVLSDGRFVLTDVDSNCIKILDQNYKVVSCVKLPSRPLCIAKVGGDQLACTLHEALKIQFMSVSGNCTREIATSSEFLGIVHIRDKLIVRDSESVQELDMEGKTSKFIYRGAVSYMASSSDGTILYVSGGISDTVTSLTLDGDVLNTYTGDENDELSFPTGLTVDNDGRVYVCGYYSNNIHQLTRDCTKIKVLYQGEVSKPYVIAYRDNKLYVGSYKKSDIKVFKLQ